METDNKQIKYGAIISYSSIGINVVVALLYIPWMAEKIGQSNYGLYVLATSFINVFLIDFGLSSAVSCFLARYRAIGDSKAANQFFTIITKLYLFIDLFIALVLLGIYFFIGFLYKGLTPEELNTFKGLYCIVGSFSVLFFPFVPVTGILTAYEKFIQMKLCDLGQKLLTVLLIVFALWNRYGVFAIVTANAVGSLFFVVVKIIIVKKSTPIRILSLHTTFDREKIKGILSFSIWTAIINLAQRYIFNIAPSILGIVSDSKEIALFSPANILEGYFYTFAAAVNGLFLAKVSRYVALKEENQIFSLMLKVGRYQMTVMGLIFIGFICVGHEFMVLWMGVEYEKAWLCSILLFIPDFLLFTEQIANTAIIVKNEVKRQAIGSIIMAVISITLSLMLCGKLGAIGSCIAIMCAYFFIYVYMNIVYKKYLGIDIRKFFKDCYISFILPYSIAVIAGWSICNKVYLSSGWFHLLIKAVMVCVIYSVVVWCFALKREEREKIKERFENGIKRIFS